MMMQQIFTFLTALNVFFWEYVGFGLILILGVYFSVKTKFFQVKAFPSIFRTFFHFLFSKEKGNGGIHPLKAFFASVGGMIGIGSVVGIVTAIQIGGPGALFWVWIAAFFGSLIKYSEVFLGLKHRVARKGGGFDGGPMYFLAKAFASKFVPIIVAVLLCLYGIEIYQFSVITSTIETNWGVDHSVAVLALLGLVLYASLGGVRRVAKICGSVMPLFMLIYVIMGAWVILNNLSLLPSVVFNVVHSAFSGQAAMGGFVGSGALLAIQNGMSRFSYSADLGIGYDSIIHSESSTILAERQARLAVFGVFLDCVMCTLSMLLVLLTGVWMADEPILASQLVQTALSDYFPFMNIFMPCFLLILGYTTLIAYACIGIKCARFLHPKYGVPVYITYGVAAWIFFSFFDQTTALVVMSLVGAFLLTLNLIGLFRLRKEVVFSHESEKTTFSVANNSEAL